MNSGTQNNAHPATLLPMLLLAIWFICQSYASADGLNVTGPGARTGLPVVSSFVPANAAVGDSVYANLDYSAVRVDHKTVTAVRLVAADGSALSAPATVHGDRLIEFRIPSGAVSGNVTMAGGDGRKSENAGYGAFAIRLKHRNVRDRVAKHGAGVAVA